MFDVLIDHLFGDVSRAPCPIANGPEVPAPVALLEVREFILKMMRCSAFEALHDAGYGKTRRIFDVHVDVVAPHGSFENADVFTITHLDEELPASFLHFSREDVVTVLCDPDQMDGQSSDRMATVAIGVVHEKKGRA